MNQNNETSIETALRLIAQKENITENEVRDGITLAVSIALKSNNPKAKEFWKNIPCEGESPTIDEITDYIILNYSKE